MENILGYVFKVKQFANGDITIFFVTTDDKELELHYFTDVSKKGEITKNMAQQLAGTLDSYIWSEIAFDDTGTATSIEYEAIDEDDFEEA